MNKQNKSQYRTGHLQSVQPPLVPRSLWWFWFYLLVIATVEAFTVLTHPRAGLVLYAGLLLWLTLHSGLGGSDTARKLALALTLVPLTRMLALSLPLIQLPRIAWYPTVAVPLFLAAWVVVRQSAQSRQALGLGIGNKPFHLMMISGGIGLGAVQYAILQPPPMSAPLPWNGWIISLVLLMFLASFTEELIFRGLIQGMAWPMMGRWALLYSATMFAVLHIGYLSISAVMFAFLTGLLFAQIVQWSGSIFGVALVHGMTSVTQLIILPHLFVSASPPGALLWLTTAGMLTPMVIMLMLAVMTLCLALVLMVLGYLCALP